MSLEEYLKAASPNVYKRFIKEMPEKLQARTGALMAIQEEHKVIGIEMEKEQMALKKKYEELFKPLFEERQRIIAGEVEVTEEQVKAGKAYMEKKAAEEEDEEDEKTERKEVPLPPMCKPEDIKKGIPDFWLECIEHNPMMEQLLEVKEWDKPILKHLTNVSCQTNDDGFTLSFHFSENEYFHNKALTKTIVWETNPGTGEDPSLTAIKCEEIQWKDASKNVTQKTKQTKTKKGSKTTTQPQESFFTYFVELDENDADMPERVEEHMEIAELFKDHIVPRAVECYCGEMFNDDDDDEEDEEFDEDMSDDDDEDEDDMPKKGKKGGKKGAADDKPKEECKQQ